MRHYLVGRSHECDFPPEILEAPICTRSHVDSTEGSGAINDAVEARLEKGLSLYELDVDSLQKLRPDFILTQAQCDVCAISMPEVERAVADLVSSQPRILSLSPRRLVDIWQNILDVAEALGVPAKGREVVKQLKNRAADVILKTAALKKRPSVACLEWLDPLMAAGNWVPELVELSGGNDQLGVAGEHSPWTSWEELAAKDPDVLILMPCGFNLEKTCAEATVLSRRDEWKSLRAVANRSVYAVDGSHYFNRPGPRLVDSLEILAEIIHPGLFPPQYKGRTWRRFVTDRPCG